VIAHDTMIPTFSSRNVSSAMTWSPIQVPDGPTIVSVTMSTMALAVACVQVCPIHFVLLSNCFS
jgi:hypothetical protein